jgi:hypothetical protein
MAEEGLLRNGKLRSWKFVNRQIRWSDCTWLRWAARPAHNCRPDSHLSRLAAGNVSAAVLDVIKALIAGDLVSGCMLAVQGGEVMPAPGP